MSFTEYNPPRDPQTDYFKNLSLVNSDGKITRSAMITIDGKLCSALRKLLRPEETAILPARLAHSQASLRELRSVDQIHHVLKNCSDPKSLSLWLAVDYLYREAILQNDTKAAEILLSMGAHKEIQAAAKKRPKIFEDRIETRPKLMLAMVRGDLAEVRQLLDNGADLNSPSIQWPTPLLFAVRQKKATELVKLLLAYGADPDLHDIRPSSGVTTLYLAVRRGNIEVVKALLQAGATISGMVGDDKFREAAAGKPEILELLRKAGLKPSSK